MLLQQAGVTNGQLLQAAKALNTAPSDAQAKLALNGAARAVIESMKKLLIATNALQVRSLARCVPRPPPPGRSCSFPFGGEHAWALQTQLQASVGGQAAAAAAAPAAAPVVVPVTAAGRLAVR